MTEEERLFSEHRPTFTDFDAKQFYDSHGPFVSVDGRYVGLDAFALKFATRFQLHGPYLMNGTTARELCRMLIAEGFGPVPTQPQ